MKVCGSHPQQGRLGQPAALTEGGRRVCCAHRMEIRTVSFKEIETAHRKERAADAVALRTGKISSGQLQEKNSFLPARASMKLVDIAGYLKQRRNRK